jgi:hypothetical protein
MRKEALDFIYSGGRFDRVANNKVFPRTSPQKASYLSEEICAQVVSSHLRREVQGDGRIRFWGRVPELQDRILRVVTLEDGLTIHNAFLDRRFSQGD